MPGLGLGDEGVDDVGDRRAFFVGELVEVGQARVDVAAGCVEKTTLGVLDDEVVDGGVEDMGHASLSEFRTVLNRGTGKRLSRQNSYRLDYNGVQMIVTKICLGEAPPTTQDKSHDRA